MTIQPVGRSRNIWSQWSTPDNLRKDDIPPSPGVYQLAVFRNDKRAMIHSATTNERLLAAESEYLGVVYIGKAVCLSERFWHLVQSWTSGTPVVRHGSRKNYNQDHRGAQGIFLPDQVRCRCKPMASVNWVKFRDERKAGLKSGAKWQEQLNAIWSDSGTLSKDLAKRPPGGEEDSMCQSAIVTFSEEGQLLKKFKTIYDCMPLLNKRKPENLGDSLTERELKKWLQDEMDKMDRIPDDHAIRQRAYEIWLGRDRPELDDWTDWFGAETELWEHVILED